MNKFQGELFFGTSNKVIWSKNIFEKGHFGNFSEIGWIGHALLVQPSMKQSSVEALRILVIQIQIHAVNGKYMESYRVSNYTLALKTVACCTRSSL